MSTLDSKAYFDCDLSGDSYYLMMDSDNHETKLSRLHEAYLWIMSYISSLIFKFIYFSKLDILYH